MDNIDYNFGDEFRMIGIDMENDKKPISLIGEKGVFQLDDFMQVSTGNEPIIIDMKAKIRFTPDENGDFIVNHLLNETLKNDAFGVVGLKYCPKNTKVKEAEMTTSYFRFLHPFSIDNRKLIEGLSLGSRIDLKVFLYQSPESEAVDDSKLEEAKMNKTAEALAEKAKEEK